MVGLWWLLVAMVVAIGLAATIFLVRKDASDPRQSHRPVLLFIGRFLALVYVGLGLIGTVVSAISTLINDAVQVALPVQQFWPKPYPWITLDPEPQASVVGGGFTVANVMVDGLGTDARLWLAAGNAVQALTFIAIAGVIALLCHRLLGGSPFRPLLARATMWAAVAITVGGIAWQVFLQIGGSIASRQVLEVTGYRGDAPSDAIGDYLFTTFTDSGLPQQSLGFQVEFWPILIGLALAAVAVAFRYSERLQRDTEGLV